MADSEPIQLGKYECRHRLGSGMIGVVYEGWDPDLGRRVAIKAVKLPDDRAEAERHLADFLHEARAAAGLSHPNIVAVYDSGRTGDLAYVVMELVQGGSLRTIIDRKERLAVEEIVRVMTELLAGLQFIHDRGITHRDIKPANVMLSTDRHVKIADFGIAKIEGTDMTEVGTVKGTPSYMSPEQWLGEPVDRRSDIFSAGALLYHLLTGERPFAGEGSAAVMHKALHVMPPPPSKVSTAPAAFDAVVARALAKRPADRFASAAEFATALRRIDTAASRAPPGGDDDGTVVVKSGAAPPPASKSTNRRLPLIAGLVVLIGIVGGGVYWAKTQFGPTGPTSVAPQHQIEPPKPPKSQSQPEPRTPLEAPKPPEQQTPPGPQNQPEQQAPPEAPKPPEQQASPQAPKPPEQQAPPEPQALPELRSHPEPTPPPGSPIQPEQQRQPQPQPPPQPEQQKQESSSSPAKRDELQAFAAALPCSLIGVSEDHGSLAVSGIADGKSVNQLASRRRDFSWTGDVHGFNQPVNGSFCKMLDLLRPLAQRPRGSLLAVSVRKPSETEASQRPLQKGDPIVLDVTAPEFDGAMQVDYFVNDGTLSHLTPRAGDPRNDLRPFTAGERLQLYGAGDKASFDANPPFGTDMVVVVAFDRASLMKQRSSDDEKDRGALDYVRALGQAIEEAERSGVKLAVGAALVETVAKR